MQQKPPRWNIAPALVAPEAQSLWKGLAFMAPLWGHASKGALLGPHGGPLAGANLATGANLQWRGTPYGLGVGVSAYPNSGLTRRRPLKKLIIAAFRHLLS